MGLSPLQLVSYFFEEVSFKANPEYKEGNARGLNISFEAGENKENPLLRRIVLKISQDKVPEQPYEFNMTIFGIFQIEESFAARKTTEEIEKLINTNCPSILYSAAREMLVLITGRGPYEKIFLPAISFSDFLPENKKRKTPAKPQKLIKS